VGVGHTQLSWVGQWRSIQADLGSQDMLARVLFWMLQGADKAIRRPGSAQQGLDKSALSLALQKSFSNARRESNVSGASGLSARYSESPRSGMPWGRDASIKASECTPEQYAPATSQSASRLCCFLNSDHTLACSIHFILVGGKGCLSFHQLCFLEQKVMPTISKPFKISIRTATAKLQQPRQNCPYPSTNRCSGKLWI